MLINSSGAGSHTRRRRFAPVILPATIAGMFAFALVIFLGVGHWLIVEDPLEKAQAIVVLSGGMPMRAQEAAQLYNAGLAPQVWLTRSVEPADSLQKMHIAYIGEDFFDARILMQQGVPSNAIIVLEPAINNTVDEVKCTLAELARSNARTVIVVTSKAHTRRVRTLWKDLSGGRGRAIVRAASTDPFAPGHWWGTTRDALEVVREILGLVNTWAGLPLQPSR